MSNTEITIKGELFRLDFSLMSLMVLGEKWGLETLEEVIAKIAELDNGDNKLALSKLRMFDEIIQSLANSAEGNPRILNDFEVLRLPMAEVMQLLTFFSDMMIKAVQSKSETIQGSLGNLKAPKRAKSKVL